MRDEPKDKSEKTTHGSVEAAVAGALGEDGPRERVGDVIGHYRLREVIGEGGFGVVWLAEQLEPVRRKVALKVIKPGMDSRAVIARFEAERQALALMSHPNVAKVLDAGATPAGVGGVGGGRPYFVMEHVKGVAITEYCDRERLTVEQRLKLFAVVCDAVQHAHMRGIIHRDLKPSNILVTIAGGGEGGGARPVVIDFGVAKALAGRLTEATIHTERGVLIGTPEYMSPEQAEANESEIDTRTDVYSLGVILYELLTGALPFDTKALRSGGQAAIQKMIREVDPPRPSTKLSTMGEARAAAAAARSLRLEELESLLKKELEWIPLKAMRKDRVERYRSASELADDVGNYLENRPLIAGPESAGYKARKFVRRNKGAVAAGALIVATMVVATGVSVWFGVSERRQRAIAEASAEGESQALKRAAFIVDLLKAEDPYAGGTQDITVGAAMGEAIVRIDSGAFKGDAASEATLRDTIGTILSHTGRTTEAEPVLAKALELRRGTLKGDSAELAVSLDALARARLELGRVEDADKLFAESLEMRRRLYKGDHESVAEGLYELGRVRQAQSRFKDAEGLYTESLEMFRRLHPGDHSDVAHMLSTLALLRLNVGNTKDAERLFDESLAMYERLYEGDNADVASLLSNVATVKQANGKAAEAEPIFVQALEMFRRLFKKDHPNVAISLNRLANVRHALGRAAEAETLMIEALEMNRRMYPGDNPDVAIAMSNVAAVQTGLGRHKDAEKLAAEALAMQRRLHEGKDHRDVAFALDTLAVPIFKQGRLAEAYPLMLEALEMYQRLFPRDHPDVAKSLLNVGFSLKGLKRMPEAEGRMVEACAMFRRLHPDGDGNLAVGLDGLASVRKSLGHPEEAVAPLRESLAINRRLIKGDNAVVANGLTKLAFVLSTIGEFAESERVYAEAVGMNRRMTPGDNAETADGLVGLARAQQAQGKRAEARTTLEEAIAMLRRLGPEGGSIALAGALRRSGEARLENGEEKGVARRELEEAVAIGEKVFAPEDPQLKEMREALEKCK